MKLTREFPSNYTMAQWQTADHADAQVVGELFAHFGAERFTVQSTRTGVPVIWLSRDLLLDVMGFLQKLPSPFVMLFDLSATDERMRSHRHALPRSDFTVFYHLISIDRNADVMLKVALKESDLWFSLIGICAFYTVLLIVEMYLMFKFARKGPSSLKSGKYHFETHSA